MNWGLDEEKRELHKTKIVQKATGFIRKCEKVTTRKFNDEPIFREIGCMLE